MRRVVIECEPTEQYSTEKDDRRWRATITKRITKLTTKVQTTRG